MWERGFFTISSGVPSATSAPPSFPPSGPRSTIQSAFLMTSRLCSMTRTVFPASQKRWRTAEQLAHVVEVEAGRRLVEDVEGLPGAPPRELGGELDALGLPAREGGRGLAERDVAEPDLPQGPELPGDLRDRLEEDEGLVHGHVEHLGDALPLVLHLERLAVVARALADVAGDVDVGEEVHLDPDRAVPLAVLAAPALHVEGESPGLVAAHLRLGELGEDSS